MHEYELLEIELESWINWGDVVVCSSGTAALHLAFEVLKSTNHLTDNDHVIVPDTTMIACPRSVTMAGLKPSLCDVDDLGLLDRDRIATPHKAVLAVHLYGRECVTDNHNAPVIEDCAEAHGIQPNENSFAACWSFYRNKIICGEEGGAVVFKNSEHAELARSLRTLGMTERHDFMHNPRGMNYRLSNLHAKPIRLSLKHYHTNIAKRRSIEAMYNSVVDQEWQLPTRSFPWVYDLDLPPGIDTWKVTQKLIARGVAARVAFKPMSCQEEYCTGRPCCINSQHIVDRRIYLPIDPKFNQFVVNRIVSVLGDAVDSLKLIACE